MNSGLILGVCVNSGLIPGVGVNSEVILGVGMIPGIISRWNDKIFSKNQFKENITGRTTD